MIPCKSCICLAICKGIAKQKPTVGPYGKYIDERIASRCKLLSNYIYLIIDPDNVHKAYQNTVDFFYPDQCIKILPER